MKKTSLTLFLITLAWGWLGAQISIKPEHPRPGAPVEIYFAANSSKLLLEKDVELVVVSYAYKNPVIVEPTLNKMGDHWVATIPTDDQTLALTFALKHGENWDNNNGEGYFINMYDAKGGAIPETYAAQAVLYRDFGRYANLNRNGSVAMELLEKSFSLQPALQRKYLPSYINCILSVKRGEDGKTQVRSLLAKVEADPMAEETDLLVAANAYQRIGDTEKANAIREKLRTQFPKGAQVKADRKKEINAENNLQKREEMITLYENQFPAQNDDEREEMQYMWLDLCSAYAEEGNLERSENLMRNLNNPNRAAFYNSIAWNQAEKKENLDKCREWALTAKELAQKELENPSTPKPALSTNKEWQDERRYSYGSYADTYAFVLFQSGETAQALEIQKDAVEYSNSENSEINERYANYLEAAKSPDLIPELEKFLATGKATPAMKAQFLKAYAAQNGDKAADARLAELNAKATEHMRNELQSKMMNMQAPAFSLTNLKGETVSLASLKGKVVVIDFWATWCGPCKASFPAMQKAQEKFKDNKNVAFVFVDTWERGEDKAKIAGDFISSKGYPFNVLIDGEDKVVSAYGVSGIPTKFIVDKNGIIRFKSVGFGGNDDALVDELSLMIEVAGKQ